MATWKLQVTHALAHIEPTLTYGTAHAGFPKGNVRTLDPNMQARWDAPVAVNPIEIRFDRGATMTLNPINACTVLNHNWSDFYGSAQYFYVYTGASAGATTNTRVSWSQANTDPIFETFVDDTSQHITLKIGAAGDTNYYAGLVTLGQYFDLGNPVYGEQWGATSPGGPDVASSGAAYVTNTYHGARTVRAKFRKITRAAAYEIMFLYHQRYVMYPTSTTARVIAEVGAGGGANPVVLVDDNGKVYYGPAQITMTSWGGQYVELDIALTEIPYRKSFDYT